MNLSPEAFVLSILVTLLLGFFVGCLLMRRSVKKALELMHQSRDELFAAYRRAEEEERARLERRDSRKTSLSCRIETKPVTDADIIQLHKFPERKKGEP